MSELWPLLARQPIFNRKMQVVAYELLCRNYDIDFTSPEGGDTASSQVLLHTFTDLSIQSVVGKHQAFINFTRTLLLAPPPFHQDQLVIEVLEGQKVDAQMLHSLKRLREKGYTIALDDFELTEETRGLIPYADIIKLDVLQLSTEQIIEHVEHLKSFGITLVAEKVETYEMLEFCKSLGFDLFQGYFLARPKIIKGRKITENKQAVLQLLSVMHNPDVHLDEVERLIAHDPMLSYKLLRLVNSAAFALPRTIDSLRQAIALLGLDIIKNWINLLAMANMGDKPLELSIAALTRARMCAAIATAMNGRSRSDSFFTVGLLSTLDAFMDAPLEILLKNLSLNKNLNEALLEHSGDEGRVLEIVEHYEKADWEKIDWEYLSQNNITPDTLTHIYLDAISWVSNTVETLGVTVK
jgi:EAL and modified HD-GYP domain-containing signal transduction protein